MSVQLIPGRAIPKHCDADLLELAEAINGFLYHGESLEAMLKTVRVLRANPAFAKRLLDLS